MYILLMFNIELMILLGFGDSTDGMYKESRCEPLKMPLCRGLWYNRTRLPNMFHHETQEEAGLQAHQFMHLVTIKCSPDLHFFLCSIYTPICVDNYDKPLPPCRSVCERSKQGCAPILKNYGFAWPTHLTCDQFPATSTGTQLCMEKVDQLDQRTNQRNPVISTKSPLPARTHTSEEPSPQSAPTAIGPTDKHRNSTSDDGTPSIHPAFQTPCLCKCRHPFINLQHHQTHPYYNKAQVLTQSNCAWPCRLSTNPPSTLVTTVLGVVLILTCTNSLLTQLLRLSPCTATPSPSINYLLSMSLCLSISTSTSSILRIILGHNTLACTPSQSNQLSHSDPTLLLIQLAAHTSNTQATSQHPTYWCSISFLLTYFFFLAGLSWWLVSCVSYCLQSALGYSPSMVYKYSQLFHMVSWLLPGLLSLLALTMSLVDGDPVTGTCLLGNTKPGVLAAMLLTPVTVALASGTFCLVLGAVNTVHHPPSTPPHPHSAGNLGSQNTALSYTPNRKASSHPPPTTNRRPVAKPPGQVWTALCLLPFCMTFLGLVYQVHVTPAYLQGMLCKGSACTEQVSTDIPTAWSLGLMTLLKYSGIFLPAIICGPWILPWHSTMVLIKKWHHSFGPGRSSSYVPSSSTKHLKLYNNSFYNGCYQAQVGLATVSSLSHLQSNKPHYHPQSTTNESLLLSSVLTNLTSSTSQLPPSTSTNQVRLPIPQPKLRDSNSDIYASYQSLSKLSSVPHNWTSSLI